MFKIIQATLFSFISVFTMAQAIQFTPKGEFTNNCEGPAVDEFGNIYAVNIFKDGTIAKITPDGKTSKFLTLPEGSTGNGIRFGDRHTVYIADFTGHNILKADLRTLEVKVHAHEATMNQPNDLAIKKNGDIYCSDPNWAKETGRVWYVPAKGGKASLVAENMGTTNGIEVSPDEKTLYVNESIQRSVWAFDIAKDGLLSNKRLLITFPDHLLDGMRCDEKGNIYVTRYGKGEVVKLSPTGKVLETFTTLGAKVSNICFGGKKGKTAYITLQDNGNIETFEVSHTSREWKMMQSFKKQ